MKVEGVRTYYSGICCVVYLLFPHRSEMVDPMGDRLISWMSLKEVPKNSKCIIFCSPIVSTTYADITSSLRCVWYYIIGRNVDLPVGVGAVFAAMNMTAGHTKVCIGVLMCFGVLV